MRLPNYFCVRFGPFFMNWGHSDKDQSSTGGLGFLGALTILFVALKLTGFIDWSWWWVWAPLWLVWGGLGALAINGYTAYRFYRKYQDKRSEKRWRERQGY